jgi:mannose-6-phosphate isomerase
MPLPPLRFHPRYKERVWGGRALAEVFGRALPGDAPIGESWELADRPGDVSVVAAGPHAGRTLRELMERHGRDLLGGAAAHDGRFPLLVKILDAQDVLSLQVHPPAHLAAALGGEPKTELWYFVQAAPGAHLYAGLRRGVTREEFARRAAEGSVAGCFHRLDVRAGDSLFLPSGRVHALGAGLLLFEIQQNSDTTYRVFDWNRVGLDGRPRETHLEPALASIDFADVEPPLTPAAWREAGSVRERALVEDGPFRVRVVTWPSAGRHAAVFTRPQVLGVVRGTVTVATPAGEAVLEAGGFAVLPAVPGEATFAAGPAAEMLVAEPA